MKKIDLAQLIETHNLDKKDLGVQLFPGNKYKGLALNRVISGQSLLDADQISKLSLIVGLPISSLYGKTKWSNKSKKGIHEFFNGDYRAELDTKTWVTKIFHKSSLFHESILHSGSIPLSEYIEKLNSIINKHN